MARLPALFLFFLLFRLPLFAQVECASDLVHKTLMATDTGYNHNYLRMQSQLRDLIRPGIVQRGGDAPYTIPVVVHVLHSGEPIGTGVNISDEKIKDAIAGLNERFSNTRGTGSLDIGIRFCLANRDPSGCPTTGITRTNASAVNVYGSIGVSVNGCVTGVNPVELTNLSKWPAAEYYNIWVVNTICDGKYSGYAYYPTGGSLDGTFIQSVSMNSSSSVLTHELGHGFNLLHTFEGDANSTSCPLNTNCSLNGDQCCDTPPQLQTGCGTANSCNGTGDWENSLLNYMSYCSNLVRFTKDQKDRMQATMLTYPRSLLATSTACGGPTSVSLPPTPGPITGDLHQQSYSGNFSVSSPIAGYTYQWSVNNNGSIYTGQGQADVLVIFPGPGNYTISVTRASGCGISAAGSRDLVVKQITNPSGTNIDQFALSVAPNPSDGRFLLKLLGVRGVDIKAELLNVTGQRIYEFRQLRSPDTLEKLIDLTDRAAGIYYLRIQVGSVIHTRRLLKN